MIFFSIFFRQVFSIFQMIFLLQKTRFLFLTRFFLIFVAGKKKGKEFSASITIEGVFLHAKFHGRIFTADILLGLMKGRDGIHLKSTKEVKINEE